MPFIIWNGELISQEHLIISPDNRSFRYGDGCFETIKVIKGNIILQDLHFKRLLSSLDILLITIPHFFTQEYFVKQILQIVSANNHVNQAKVRMTIYRNGEEMKLSSSDNSLQFIVQSWHDEEGSNQFNKEGLSIDIYTAAKKSCDVFSSIKSNNFLPYLMGKLWADKLKLDDCLIINSNGAIADATIANVFIIVDGLIKTPSISEGCVNGTMRKYLLNCFEKEKIQFEETVLREADLLIASEIFLTNALYGIRWVNRVGNRQYVNETSFLLHHQFVTPLFQPQNNSQN